MDNSLSFDNKFLETLSNDPLQNLPALAFDVYVTSRAVFELTTKPGTFYVGLMFVQFTQYAQINLTN